MEANEKSDTVLLAAVLKGENGAKDKDKPLEREGNGKTPSTKQSLTTWKTVSYLNMMRP